MAISDFIASQIQSSISNGFVNQQNALLDNPTTYTSTDIPQPADKIVSSLSTNMIYTFPTDRPKYYMNLNFAKYSRQSISAVGHLRNYGLIRLPLPMKLVDGHASNWQQDNLNFAGALTADGIKALAGGGGQHNITGGLTATVAGLGAAATKFVGGATSAASNLGIGGVIGGAIGAAGAGAIEAGQALTGVAPNKFLTVLFKGPTYRKNDFYWRLTPRNAQESEQIRLIVKTINNAMSPTVFLNAGPSTVLFGYPDIVVMEFRPNAKYLYKFKPAVITSFSANYAPGGSAAFYHDSNAPESVDIAMSTLELEYWLSNKDAAQGGDGDFTDSNNTGDVYGGTYGVSGEPGNTTGNNSRVLGTIGGNGGQLVNANGETVNLNAESYQKVADAVNENIVPGAQSLNSAINGSGTQGASVTPGADSLYNGFQYLSGRVRGLAGSGS